MKRARFESTRGGRRFGYPFGEVLIPHIQKQDVWGTRSLLVPIPQNPTSHNQKQDAWGTYSLLVPTAPEFNVPHIRKQDVWGTHNLLVPAASEFNVPHIRKQDVWGTRSLLVPAAPDFNVPHIRKQDVWGHPVCYLLLSPLLQKLLHFQCCHAAAARGGNRLAIAPVLHIAASILPEYS